MSDGFDELVKRGHLEDEDDDFIEEYDEEEEEEEEEEEIEKSGKKKKRKIDQSLVLMEAEEDDEEYDDQDEEDEDRIDGKEIFDLKILILIFLQNLVMTSVIYLTKSTDMIFIKLLKEMTSMMKS